MKQRLDAEKRMKDAGRLPKGQSLTLRFPVLHYGGVPAFDKKSWRFRIFGLVEEETTLTWDEFCSLPQTEITMDIHCVTAWSKADTLWSGVSLRTLISTGVAKINKDATVLVQH